MEQKIKGFVRLKMPGCHMCNSGLPLDSDGVHEDRFGEKAKCERLAGQGVYMLLTSPSGATGEVLGSLVLHPGPEHEEVYTKAAHDEAVNFHMRQVLLDVAAFNAAGASIARSVAHKHGITL